MPAMPSLFRFSGSAAGAAFGAALAVSWMLAPGALAQQAASPPGGGGGGRGARRDD